MKMFTKKLPLMALTMGLVLSSCSTDVESPNLEPELKAVSAKSSINLSTDRVSPLQSITSSHGIITDNSPFSLATAVVPSECGDTPFREVTSFYNDALIDGFLSSWDGNPDAIGIILEDYFIINQIAALDENFNADTFGANGEYTHYVNNRVRSLEKFWDMSDLIEVRGQHTSTLEDLDFIRSVYENYSSATAEEIDDIMEIAEHFNTTSDQIPENPFYASDGFATFSRFIVVGDGIVSMLAETGIDPKVVWSSIMAHEWAHQIQFLNFGVFDYPLPAFDRTPESTRMTELEADFLTAYYLAHKRGATYNWKRVEGALQAFFEIGDCGFTSDGHHGTPLQRMEAARLGYELATSAQKKGKILSQQAAHDGFIAVFDGIVGGGSVATGNSGNMQ